MDMIRVFLSYRREDSRHQAGRLYDQLVKQFGKGHVFKDVDSIPLGLDFREILTERVADCDVFLAVIGDAWLSIAGKSGTRRLDDPGDFVRIEIEAALGRNIPVIPVLVGNSLRWRVAPFFLAHFIVAGLDVGRFGWSGPVPLVVHGTGLLFYVSGIALAMRALVVNRFFSPVVRIQEERGHRLITEGPYRFVRHPGYAGMLLSFLGSGLVLGSWWSLLPLIPVVVLILRRTILEDHYLREHLEGYVGYAERVRYRLLPGVW